MSSLFRKKRTTSTSKADKKDTKTEDAAQLEKTNSSSSSSSSSGSALTSVGSAVMAVQPVVKSRGFFKRAPTVVGIELPTCEADRLRLDKDRKENWKRWGPYLSERQWATVREDYSDDGSWLVFVVDSIIDLVLYYTSWDYFPHDHARSRAYRWGEDGLLGITDRQCRLCFGLALWNGNDPILKVINCLQLIYLID